MRKFEKPEIAVEKFGIASVIETSGDAEPGLEVQPGTGNLGGGGTGVEWPDANSASQTNLFD